MTSIVNLSNTNNILYFFYLIVNVANLDDLQ